MRKGTERFDLLLPLGALVAGLLLLLVLLRPAGSPPPRLPAARAPESIPSAPAPAPSPPETPGAVPAPVAPGDEGKAGEEGGARGEGPGEGEGAKPAEVGPLPESGVSPNGFFLRPAGRETVMAKLARDPAGGPAPAVRPGRASPLPLAELLESGLSRVRGTVELVGDRKPAVEKGVPVGLSGVVREAEGGDPIRGAVVVLRSAFYERSIWYDHDLVEVARVETDADGAFRIDRLNVDPVHFGKGGLVYLSVRSPDHAPLLAIPLANVTPGYENRLDDLVLTRAKYVVTGRVIDYWENKPVAGGRVVATGEIQPIQYPKDQREALFLSAPQTVTDADGRFTLENVGPGPQMISVHGGNDCIGYRMIRVPAKGEVVLRTRQIRGRITGRVLDDRDRPIPLVRIDGGGNTTHTFEDGSFVLENFRGDSVTLSLTHTDFRPKSVPDVADGTEGLALRMESRWPELRFRVRTWDGGEPVPGVSVTLEFGKGRSAPLPASPFYVSGAGVYAVRVPEGVVRARIGAPGLRETEVDLEGARDGDVVDVLLRAR